MLCDKGRMISNFLKFARVQRFPMLKQLFGQKFPSNPESDPAFSTRPIRIHSVTLLTNQEKPGAPVKSRIAFEVTNPPGPYSMQFLTVLGGADIQAAFPVNAIATYFESRNGAALRAIKSAEGVLYKESL